MENSENASFARVCEDYGIKFIGPKSAVLTMIKNKANVRKIAKELSVPILPGSVEPVNSIDEAKKISADVGYPVMLKASLGGGGRGIRPIKSEEELIDQYPIAASEARASFGSDALYIEKFLDKPRHIEVQILGDEFVWSVCAAGRHQFRMCNLALLMGGHTRVGLEDSLYLSKGRMAKSSAEQVEKIVRIGREHGLEPASPDEAREILNLKGIEKVKY